jgi:hypothetical protein
MCAKKRRTFGERRPTGVRRYRKIIVVASEGKVTEVEYFSRLNSVRTTVRLHCLKKGNKNSPEQVLEAIEVHLAKERLRKNDEAWIVVDTDSWGAAALDKLHEWSTRKVAYGLAVSNPKFELWVLLHFEDGNGAVTPAAIGNRLGKYLDGKGKHLAGAWVTEDRIQDAVRRARAKDVPPCTDWPRAAPRTTVYKLVERFLAEE